jgi:hypothetical protein
LLLDAAADGADDQDVTPAEIASEISAALARAEGEPRRLLQEALDAVSDGLPADHVATILKAALANLSGSTTP